MMRLRANVSKPEDLSSIATGVQIGTSGGMAQVYIRGVGSYGTQTFAESPIAFNIDGVYISRIWATRGIFYDLERVEVLDARGKIVTPGFVHIHTQYDGQATWDSWIAPSDIAPIRGRSHERL